MSLKDHLWANAVPESRKRISAAWKILRHGTPVKTWSNRGYWNRMAESGKVNWHISHHSQEQEAEFWSSGNDVRQDLLAASFLGSIDRLPPNARVLDVGCGRGRISRAFASVRSDLEVIGVDVSTSMIDNARASNAGIANLYFVPSEENGFPVIERGSVDFVYSYVVLQHLPRQQVERIVDDCRRVLRPTGELVFQMQGCETPQELDPAWNDYRGIRKYTEKQLRHFLERLFIDVKITGAGEHTYAACRTKK